MHDVRIPPEFIQDPPALNQPEMADEVGRDPERTPMQWDSSPNAGFTEPGITPWLPIAEDYQSVNVEVEEQDPRSMLSLFRALTGLRRREPALAVGDYASLTMPDPDIFAYVRSSGDGRRFLVVLNFGSNEHQLDLGDVSRARYIEVSTGMDRQGPVTLSDYLELRGDEGLVIRLTD